MSYLLKASLYGDGFWLLLNGQAASINLTLHEASQAGDGDGVGDGLQAVIRILLLLARQAKSTPSVSWRVPWDHDFG